MVNTQIVWPSNFPPFKCGSLCFCLHYNIIFLIFKKKKDSSAQYIKHETFFFIMYWVVTKPVVIDFGFTHTYYIIAFNMHSTFSINLFIQYILIYLFFFGMVDFFLHILTNFFKLEYSWLPWICDSHNRYLGPNKLE